MVEEDEAVTEESSENNTSEAAAEQEDTGENIPQGDEGGSSEPPQAEVGSDQSEDETSEEESESGARDSGGGEGEDSQEAVSSDGEESASEPASNSSEQSADAEKEDSLNKDYSWDLSKQLVGRLGNFNDLLAQAAWSLNRTGRNSDSDEVDSTCTFLMRSLLYTPDIRSKFYHAWLTLDENSSNDNPEVSGEELISSFKRGEHAAIVSVIYLYHKARKVFQGDYSLDVDKEIQEFCEAGMLVGKSLSNVGVADCMLVVTIRYIAFSLFGCLGPNKFGDYYGGLKKERKLFDIKKEGELFNCNHAQIGSLILQKLGFDVRKTHSIFVALNHFCP